MLHSPVASATGAAGARQPLGARGVELVPSRLSQRLADPGRDDVREAFVRARRTVIAGERLDVGALAAGLGVDRTSLFRWVGSRDDLLTEVLWSVAAPTLDATDAASRAGAHGSTAAGAERIVEVLTGFVEAMITAAFFRQLLQREPLRAMRLLTTTAGHVQRRFTAVVESLVTEETRAGLLTHALPAHDLAYLLVRVAESFAYADLIAGEQPDATRARAAFAAVMGCSAVPPRPEET